MDKKDFIDLVNTLAESRIRQVLPEVIGKELQKELKKIVDEVINRDTIRDIVQEVIAEGTPINTSFSDILEEEEIPKVKQKPRVAKQVEQESAPIQEIRFSKNPILNKMLNETARTPPGGEYESAKRLMESQLAAQYAEIDEEADVETMQFGSVPDFASKLPKRLVSSPAPVAEAKREVLKQQIIQQSGNETIANAMVKDYRSVLKIADKIAATSTDNPYMQLSAQSADGNRKAPRRLIQRPRRHVKRSNEACTCTHTNPDQPLRS